MKTKKESALLQQERPQRKNPHHNDTSSNAESQSVNELYRMRASQNIPAADMVAVVKELYPRFDKPLLSKVQRPELYGVDLRQDALNALREKYSTSAVATDADASPEAAPSRSTAHDDHRLKCRIMCRLEDDEYLELLRHIKQDGYHTMQAWLQAMVRRYLKRKNRKESGDAKHS